MVPRYTPTATPESEFAAWLAEQLGRRAWSAAELVRRYRQSFDDLTDSQTSRYLRSQNTPTRAKAERIALILGAELPALYRPWHRFHPRPQPSYATA